MKNLYNRLKPELKEKLLLNLKIYPSIIEKIIKALKYKDFYNELTIEEVKDLCTYCNLDWNKIDWKWGEDMFEVRQTNKITR